MALPNSNISISMVRNELGESSNDLSVLCRSDKINKWSKWKPVNNSVVTNTQATLAAINYGISAPTQYNSPQSLHTALLSTTFYNYQKPSMYRLGDFRNYEHNSYLPAGSGVKFGTTKDIYKTSYRPITYFSFPESFESDYSVGREFIENAVGYELFQCVVIIIDGSYFWTSSNDVLRWDWSSIGKQNYQGSINVFFCYSNTNKLNEIKSVVEFGTERYIPIPTDPDNSNPFPAMIHNETAPDPRFNISATVFGLGAITLIFNAEGKTGGNTGTWTAEVYDGRPGNGGVYLGVKTITTGVYVNAGEVKTINVLLSGYPVNENTWVQFYNDGVLFSTTNVGQEVDPN